MVLAMIQSSDPLPSLEPYIGRPAKRPWPIKWALLGTIVSAGVCLTGLYFGARAWLGNPKVASEKTLSTTDLFNLLKLIFAVIAGLGGIVALVVAYRRQKVLEEQIRLSVRTQVHAEQVAKVSAYDATERRVTDLYGQSVEQLGNARAAVRLGGLYSLERLAQDYEQHRQAVVDVVCAYLRMPFQMPEADSTSASSNTVDARNGSGEGPEQELQVRLAGQRLLSRHLRVPVRERPDSPVASSTYWTNIRVDLTGSYLIDLDFSNCSFLSADFSGARFSKGRVRFTNSQFTEDALFSDGTFEVGADFGEANFGGGASFTGSTFVGQANYSKARFENNLGFNRASFKHDAFFEDATFNGTAWFRRVRFEGDAQFRRATFGQHTVFDHAQFNGDANFARSRFQGTAQFRNVNFGHRTQFIESEFDGEATFKGAYFKLSPRFTRVKFGSAAIFASAHFDKGPDLSGAIAMAPNSMHRWPSNWKIDENTPDGETGILVQTYLPMSSRSGAAHHERPAAEYVGAANQESEVRH